MQIALQSHQLLPEYWNSIIPIYVFTDFFENDENIKLFKKFNLFFNNNEYLLLTIRYHLTVISDYHLLVKIYVIYNHDKKKKHLSCLQ